MDLFVLRLKNHLFPKMPKSYTDCVQNALKKAGVQPKRRNRVPVLTISIAAVSVAASIALIIIGAVLRGMSPEIRPGTETVLPPTPPAVPIASAEPAWYATRIIAAKDPSGLYSDEDAEHYGRCILSFLRECGESEPDELWILRVRPLYNDLHADDTASYVSNVLVLAQSRFGESDGPDVYCIQGHNDGEVLWGTQDGSLGPQRVLGRFYGQERWILFGANTDEEGSLGHIRGCYLTGGEDGSDIEFSAFLTNDEARRPFENSRYYDRLSEYYLAVVAESEHDRLLDLSLLLVTDNSNYAFPIREKVPELVAVSAADAEQIRNTVEELLSNTAKNGETSIFNLSNQPRDTAEAYAEAILSWLKQHGTEPEELWICGTARFAFSQEEPDDKAYILAMYAFDGETGPELFCYRNGMILWQTTGYDPYCINTVYDPEFKMNCLFGFSPAYDNGPVAMEKGQFTVEHAGETFSDDSTAFYPERPFAELPKLLSGSKHTEWMRESFVFPYPKDYRLRNCIFTTEDGRTFSAPDGINVLDLIRGPVE